MAKSNDTKTTDNEDPNLGAVQEPQANTENPELDAPVSDEGAADAAEAPADPDDAEQDNPDASDKVGEASGPMSNEEKAAEKHPDSAKKTNPVGEATQHESLDPYAAGHTIANPEPNNGARKDGEDAPLPSANDETPSQEKLDEKTADTIQDQKHVEANTDAAK